jgi:RNA polymerase-binding transcription factor DksA
MTTDNSTKRCSLCGNPISPDRLEILPNATTCVECAAKHPQKKIMARDLDLSQSSPIDRTGFAPSD